MRALLVLLAIASTGAAAQDSTALFPAPLDGDRWGYIDRTGAVVIPAAYDVAYPFSEGRARVEQQDRTRYIDQEGAPVGGDFEDGSDFEAGYARVVSAVGRDDLMAYMDAEGGLVTPFAYEQGTAFSDGVAAVQEPQRRRTWRLLTRDGERSDVRFYEAVQPAEGLVPVQFSSRLLFFRLAGAWGYVDADGAPVIEPRFDAAFRFSEGKAAVSLGGRIGYIDASGAMQIAPRFRVGGPFRDGHARVLVAEGWGFIDASGAWMLPPRFEAALDFSEGLAAVQDAGRWRFVDASGQPAFAGRFDYAQPFRDGLAYVRDGDREGYIDRTGAFVWTRER